MSISRTFFFYWLCSRDHMPLFATRPSRAAVGTPEKPVPKAEIGPPDPPKKVR